MREKRALALKQVRMWSYLPGFLQITCLAPSLLFPSLHSSLPPFFLCLPLPSPLPFFLSVWTRAALLAPWKLLCQGGCVLTLQSSLTQRLSEKAALTPGLLRDAAATAAFSCPAQRP